MLLGILGALAGIIVLEIATGGAITAAITNIMNAAAAVSVMDTITQAAGRGMKSLQRGFTKGGSKLKNLLDRLLTRFKFKKFKVERKGSHIRIYSEVNPLGAAV